MLSEQWRTLLLVLLMYSGSVSADNGLQKAITKASKGLQETGMAQETEIHLTRRNTKRPDPIVHSLKAVEIFLDMLGNIPIVGIGFNIAASIVGVFNNILIPLFWSSEDIYEEFRPRVLEDIQNVLDRNTEQKATKKVESIQRQVEQLIDLYFTGCGKTSDSTSLETYMRDNSDDLTIANVLHFIATNNINNNYSNCHTYNTRLHALEVDIGNDQDVFLAWDPVSTIYPFSRFASIHLILIMQVILISPNENDKMAFQKSLGEHADVYGSYILRTIHRVASVAETKAHYSPGRSVVGFRDKYKQTVEDLSDQMGINMIKQIEPLQNNIKVNDVMSFFSIISDPRSYTACPRHNVCKLQQCDDGGFNPFRKDDKGNYLCAATLFKIRKAPNGNTNQTDIILSCEAVVLRSIVAYCYQTSFLQPLKNEGNVSCVATSEIDLAEYHVVINADDKECQAPIEDRDAITITGIDGVFIQSNQGNMLKWRKIAKSGSQTIIADIFRIYKNGSSLDSTPEDQHGTSAGDRFFKGQLLYVWMLWLLFLGTKVVM